MPSQNAFDLDGDFVPAYESFMAFQNRATLPFCITISQGNDIVYPFRFKISDDFEESYFYCKKILLTLLWAVGGERIAFSPKNDFSQKLKEAISQDKEYLSSAKAMEETLGKNVEISLSEEPPSRKDKISPFGDSLKGRRIGLDLGGSDRKVTACIDGEVIFSEETLWTPKPEKDWHYHEAGILDSLRKAKAALGGEVDAIGVSTAGVVLNNELTFPALFANVSLEDKQAHVRTIFKDIIEKEFPGIPFQVENDGDVSAIGACLLFQQKSVLGLALGTSFAAGYAEDGHLLSWVNELSKVPVNFSPNARDHYILGIKGAASDYLSQKGVVLLAEASGVELQGDLPAKLVQLQKMANQGDEKVLKVYSEVGIYLGSSLCYLSLFYRASSALLLGRVMTGKGGDALLSSAQHYINSKGINIHLFTGDENFKRLGQSYIAASLPKLS